MGVAEAVDFVIGVDTHKATHTAAIVTPMGGVLAQGSRNHRNENVRQVGG
jgi:hypothetical protein